ncbi:hypothetical protein PILCRDRAFT_144819 [Piloderma croceum F 1598]|uniref:Uncharacterized protein n=1 Tax=Piloderma croceum (strain F 1598) TaxID=765440 RepID=A0A0C3GGF1_PILCF|nr:hypothetical protein PILCRDRAFT_144819 [Piloderma croceum F 1598]
MVAAEEALDYVNIGSSAVNQSDGAMSRRGWYIDTHIHVPLSDGPWRVYQDLKVSRHSEWYSFDVYRCRPINKSGCPVLFPLLESMGVNGEVSQSLLPALTSISRGQTPSSWCTFAAALDKRPPRADNEESMYIT